MKKLTTLAAIIALTPLSAFAANVKLINDTGNKVSIHTGTGFVTLNKGGSTSFSCKPGKAVSKADSGKKKDVIFKVESKHCGKTVKLSSVM
ncbi:MAG: hypothetical protein HWD86_00590 [Kangiellaceae bacterium]|nr:hypothetical protein [Kangiellaceae bacterium]